MADNDHKLPGGPGPGKGAQAVMNELEAQGFLRQIQEIEGSLKGIADQLADFARSATDRAQETESFAAHILALQATIAVLARHADVAPETIVAEIQDEIKARTAKLSGNAEGSPEVLAIARSLLGGPR